MSELIGTHRGRAVGLHRATLCIRLVALAVLLPLAWFVAFSFSSEPIIEPARALTVDEGRHGEGREEATTAGDGEQEERVV